MKVNKEMLDSVEVGSNFGRIICCAMYLNAKEKKGGISATIHEQVALLQLRLQGNDEGSIARKTGFAEKTVHDALKDITAFCGARE